ncbi:response regulator transcription factor [Mucilaginibacter sp. RCC_168]|uniref:response regulator transcription factor n=1 Tax=Mucilaginibacter sp. RCC_168 TaxID=3239221 RepID=UPI00352535FF
MTSRLFTKNKRVILYGAALAVLLFLLKWLEFHFIIINNAYEVYIGAIALFFTLLGIWLALKLTKPKVQTIVVEKPVYINDVSGFSPNLRELERLNLSRRELEVLELMAEGLSNQEISARLFVSLNTIKTHSSNLFDKMEVKRRTQAIEMAKRLCIIP